MGIISVKKIYIALSTVFLLIASLLPCVALKPAPSGDNAVIESVKPSKNSEYFRVYLSEQDKIVKMSREDYIFGVIAAETGGGYEPEALKAQTVAAYTFALFRKNENKKEDYDITDDPSLDQAFLSRKDAKAKWGAYYDSYCKNIDAALSSALGYVLTDSSGNPILSAYHAVSAGRTESAKIMWGEDISYLKPVESVGDLLSPNYLSNRTFSAEEFASLLKSDVQLTGDPSGWLGEISYSDSSTVTAVKIGAQTLTGERVRTLLGLRSACFTPSYADNTFTFQVKGYGHGVGMSQYGANYMAKCGATFIEILSHYYSDCKMVRR